MFPPQVKSKISIRLPAALSLRGVSEEAIYCFAMTSTNQCIVQSDTKFEAHTSLLRVILGPPKLIFEKPYIPVR